MSKPLWLAEQQPCASKHTPAPAGYVPFFTWADRMAKTHRQIRCSDCGLWVIWIPKEPAHA